MNAFRSEAMTVHVPASSANLGPGFDCAALALDQWDSYSARITTERGVHVTTTGEGADVVPADCSHAVAQAMRHGFDAFGVRPAGFALTCVNRIPHARGLGSSAAAIVGGVLLAHALLRDADVLDSQQLLRIALGLESHPDNVAAAIAGGLTIGWLGAEPGFHRIAVSPAVPISICIPSRPLMTREARRVLPDQVSRDEAISNIARAALLVPALTTHPEFLMVATEDAIHQRQRADLYPDSFRLLTALRAAGIPAVISGAGPSVLAFAEPTQVTPFALDWVVQGSAVPTRGAWVET